MELRELRALQIAACSRVSYKGDAWYVPSQSSKTTYRVRLGAEVSCTCPDFELRQQPCKHVMAARFTADRERGGKARNPADAVPKRPTYPQAWSTYNLAQSIEKHRLQVLLHDLCQGITEPPMPWTGRKPHSAKDSIFAMCLKIYTMLSARRFNCDLQDAHEKGHLSRPIPGMKTPHFFEYAWLTPILEELVVRSSLPLRAVETEFAVDSSGFTASRFTRWYDVKHGVQKEVQDWVKVHICTGVKTNVVTAVVIKDRDAADSPQLPELVDKTAENFTIKEVSADKGYSSVANHEAIAKHNATPFISFKSNATGHAGGLYEKMFHFYSLHRDQFLQHYHKRSLIESTFSMMKRKFGDGVRNRGDTQMTNEVLCKILCHNLCCVIMSQCELGIEATFWPDGASEERAVLPLHG